MVSDFWLAGTPYAWPAPCVQKLSNERSQGQKHDKLNIMNCKFFGCENVSRSGDLCPTHYQQKLRGYEATIPNMTEHPPCSVSHCDIPAATRKGDYCRTHYQMQYRGVDPETRKARKSGKSDATCWVGDCHRKVTSKGLCNYHARQARGGRLEVPAELGVVLNSPCSFEGCDRPYICKGLCHTHYTQLKAGIGLKEIRDWRKYHKGEHICEITHCRKVAISTGLCAGHKSMQGEYKLTRERLVEIWTDPVCSNSGCGNTTRLHMDHDHATGEFRALLCSGCNTALGFLKENPDRISGLRAYIEKFQ